MKREEVFAMIDAARGAADLKHGDKTISLVAKHHPHMANTILVEEVGEIARAILECDPENLRAEIMDVLQICTAWMEAL